jgi:hypothetical protein
MSLISSKMWPSRRGPAPDHLPVCHRICASSRALRVAEKDNSWHTRTMMMTRMSPWSRGRASASSCRPVPAPSLNLSACTDMCARIAPPPSMQRTTAPSPSLIPRPHQPPVAAAGVAAATIAAIGAGLICVMLDPNTCCLSGGGNSTAQQHTNSCANIVSIFIRKILNWKSDSGDETACLRECTWLLGFTLPHSDRHALPS